MVHRGLIISTVALLVLETLLSRKGNRQCVSSRCSGVPLNPVLVQVIWEGRISDVPQEQFTFLTA